MKNIFAEIISIGDEILYGQTLDTNSHFISQKLDEIGVKVFRKTTIADKEENILKAFKEAENNADIILITGGLGPTNDDLTKPCLSKYFDSPIVINDQALAQITEFFAKRGYELTELNRMQAALPEACEMLANPKGTAPGMWFDKNGKVFVSMPGVPHEMKYLVENEVLPRVKARFELPVIYHKMIKTIGLGESFLADRIKTWEDNLPPHIRLAYLPSLGEVKLRLTATGKDINKLEKEVEMLVDKLIPLIEKYIYGFGEDTLESAVGRLLKDAGSTLATAESCTGGLLAHMITSVPGSSAYFKGSIVAYANQVKIEQLDVDEILLEKHGAVSEEVVVKMAENVRKILNTTYGLAITGIAGPDGGTPEKPVGTVWIAYADSNESISRQLKLVRDRNFNVQMSAKALLALLYRKLANID